MKNLTTITKSTQMTPSLFEKLRCPCCGYEANRRSMMSIIDNIQDAIRILELHGRERVVFKVHSGWRCPKHNKEVGGGPNSQHVKSAALDGHFETEGTTRILVAKAVLECLHELRLGGGIGTYNWGFHIDVRGKRARW